MHLLGSRSLDWSWRRRRSARCQRQPLFCLPLGRVRGQFEGRWTDNFSRGSRGFGDCRKSARTLETRSFCSPTCAAMVLSCIWQAEIHCCGLRCPKASLGHGHVSKNCRWMATTASTAPLSWSSKVKTEDSRFNPCAPIWNSAWILQEKPRTGFCFFLRLGKSLVPLLPFGLLGALRWTDILLRRAAEEMKQIQRAAKAAKLAQGLTAIRKRKRRTQGKRKTSQRPLAVSAAQDISDAEWASDSDSLTEDAEGADGSPSMPASLGKGSASAPPGPAVRRQKQSRAIPWGPFQIAPIIPASGQTGWGAISAGNIAIGATLCLARRQWAVVALWPMLCASCASSDGSLPDALMLTGRSTGRDHTTSAKGCRTLPRVCWKRRWMHWWSHGVDPHVWLLRLEPRFATCSRLLRHSAHGIHAFISMVHMCTHSRAQNALEILKYLLTCLNNVSKRSSR